MGDTAMLETQDLKARVDAAVDTGMCVAVWAQEWPERVAVTEAATGRTRTFGELNANANRLVRLMREHGLKAGDAVAIVCSNRVEFPDVLFASLRGGFRMTPVNWHLKPEEIAYVVDNCEAKALFADTRVAGMVEAADQCPQLRLKVSIGGDLPGFLPFETIDDYPGEDIADPVRGTTMLYSSGTTGRPKGVYKPNAQAVGGYDPVYDRAVDKHICTGPAYHASPLAGDIRRALNNGVPTVLMDKWDTEQVLQVIQDEKITRGHFVPIMFQRMLALPEEARAKYDLSSLKRITHGAAPCPPEVKRAMIEWLGPVLYEYYAGSEGGVGFTVTSEQWLQRPGTVGRRPHKDAAKILDDEGNECPPGVPGHIYMSLKDQGGFSYYKDDAKTYANRRGDYFTMGDIGYLDEEDWLFLTGRSAETIIAGGVNIYPQEIDNTLLGHPAIADACTVGAPDTEWGEKVVSMVVLRDGYAPTPALADNLLAYCATQLAGFKCPRKILFETELPRTATGKLLRQRARQRFWNPTESTP